MNGRVRLTDRGWSLLFLIGFLSAWPIGGYIETHWLVR